MVKYLVQRSERALVLNANTPFHSLGVNFTKCKESSLLAFSSPFTERKDCRIINFKVKASIHGFNFLEYYIQNCVFTLNLMKMTCANHFKRERYTVLRVFPGGSVVKNLPSNAGDAGEAV